MDKQNVDSNTMQYQSIKNQKEILSFVGKQMEMKNVVVNEISWAQKTNTVQPHLQKQKQTTNVDLKEREQRALDAAGMFNAQGGRQQAQGCSRTAGDGLSVLQHSDLATAHGDVMYISK